MLLDYLNQIRDKRKGNGKQYHLGYVLFFSLLACISGADSYPKIAAFIDDKFWILDEIFNMGWVKAPEKSTIRKIFYTVDYEELEDMFRKYIQDVLKFDKLAFSGVLAADGKTLRGSYDHMKDQRATQMLSIFETNLNLILAHSKIDDKTNEIPVLPELIKKLGIENKIFTMDALHCQKKL
ncbi:MAG: ISAs1 family transposase [Minisyncoccia bacterium]